MDRTEIARGIAEDLLEHEVLDENNFSDDTEAIIEYVQKTILEHLKEYVIILGSVL